uniref:Uncharacterized protein n=1 Tax=Anguilla anguilla TaxID=7936 RepID=A0A0E9RTC3_ANGAN
MNFIYTARVGPFTGRCVASNLCEARRPVFMRQNTGDARTG